ncbi:MAG: flagellar protein FlgN [Bacteroidales bacterium]|nr:flagellar protein FlgN [Clostridium sp.]MCM1203824.1 flagellar protein FlgN [Bacteroidales bacterium]
MASLIENLITTLEEESSLYEALTTESMNKTPVIVANDLNRLQEANAKEQQIVDDITVISHKRNQALREIATVLGKDADTITVSEVIHLMEKQPEFQHPLIIVRDKLVKQVENLRQVNLHNQELLQESLEMTEYSINLIQSVNQAPETANYSKGNYSGSTLGGNRPSFDAKQ